MEIRNKILKISKINDGSLFCHIAKVIIDNLNKLENLQMKEISNTVKCSDSSITKFCKSLNLKGFKELLQVLIYENNFYKVFENKHLNEELNGNQKLILKIGNYHNFIKNNLDYIYSNFKNEIIEVSKLIRKNKSKIFLIGKGANLNVIISFYNYLIKLNYNCFFSFDFDVQRNYLKNISSEDLIIIFSYSGLTEDIIDVYENSIVKNKSKVILFSANAQSPINNKKNLFVKCNSNEEVLKDQRNAIFSFNYIIMLIILVLKE